MKRIRPLISGLMVCGVALLMVTSLAAQTAQDGIVKVVNIKGNARYYTAGNTQAQPLKSGMILKPGTTIQTASGSYVDLVLNNPGAASIGGGASMTDVAYYQPKAQQDAIRVFENSVLGIDKLTVTHTGADVVTETQLDLKYGKIFGTVKKLSGASKYEVKVPNGVAGIRGTLYYLSADGVLTVLSGSVVLAYVGPDGAVLTQVVTGGQQFDARTGQLTQIPASAMDNLVQLAQELRPGPNVLPTVFTVDHTIYFVSPTQ